MGTAILRGGHMSGLSPADFGAPQNGGILVQGGSRKRKGSKRMRGGNTCTGPSMSGGSRRLRKRTGKARRHRTKSYSAGGKKRKTQRRRKHPKH